MEEKGGEDIGEYQVGEEGIGKCVVSEKGWESSKRGRRDRGGGVGGRQRGIGQHLN